ncbi:histone deacetylase [Clostridiales bacterium PH28_bin88]|nr:histone deacetylase [Clostridiales bacterium PH28_bin88]
MSGKATCIYTPEFMHYGFGDEHPFNPLRLRLWWDLLQSMGLVGDADTVIPRTATREELVTVHDGAYLAAVEAAGEAGRAVPGVERYDLGTEDNPVFPGMHKASALVVGATLTAVEEVMEGRADHALNIAGGLHHARRDRASGFCIYNDAAVAIAYLQRRYGARVAYVDTDAHHGDGVQWAFYDDSDVLTVSFHETGRYLFPGTGGVQEVGTGEGYGYSVNIPLEAFTEDDSWIEALNKVLPAALRAFKPDIIISQHGCDGHRLDPLTHLAATTRTYKYIPELIHRLAHEVSGGRWVAVGGGGYDIWRVVPRAWALLWGEMAGRVLPREIPASWRERWQGLSPVTLPRYLEDEPGAFPPMPRRLEITEKNTLTVTRLMQNHLLLNMVFPGLTGKVD